MARSPIEFADWPESLDVRFGPFRAVVRTVVDGDTVDCLIDFGFNNYSYRPVRLLGVDTPEVTGSTRTAGLAAAAYLARALPPGSRVRLHTRPTPDSFGRYLASIEREDGQDVSALLLASGHARPYGR